MARIDKLLAKAQNSPHNMRFADLCRLVESHGFERARQKGSHHIFVHERYDGILNLQDVKGEAKPYQVRQVLRILEELDLI